MKLIQKLSVLVCAAALSPVVLAAPVTANIQVTGRIIPASCTVDAGAGAFAYGDIAQGALAVDHVTQLADKSLALNISCDGNQAVALSVSDSRSDSAIDGVLGMDGARATSKFGLGKTTGGQSIGGYVMSLANVKVDAADGKTLTRATSADAWTATGVNSADLNPTDGAQLSFAADAGTTPAAGRAYTAELHARATIAATQDLGDISTDVNLDGLSVLNLTYL
jgi:type 1 fimbria pilin